MIGMEDKVNILKISDHAKKNKHKKKKSIQS